MQPSFVVTGGTGFVGGRIAQDLSQLGKVFSFARRPFAEESCQVTSVAADITGRLPEADVPAGAAFVHVASSMNAQAPEELWCVNVNGTRNVLEYAVRANARHFIFMSSGGVYGYKEACHRREGDDVSPIGYYGYTKWLAECLCRMYAALHGLTVTIFRLYFPYGPGQRRGIFPLIYRSVAEGTALTIKPRGSPVMNPVHVQDISSAVLLALQAAKGVQVFNLCGDEEVSFLDLVRMFEQRLGRTATIARTEQDDGDLLGDNTLLKQSLGWAPRRHIREILEIDYH